MHPVSCTNTHHDVTDFANHWMVLKTESWEWNINFPRNEKIPNLCHRLLVLRFFGLVADLTCKSFDQFWFKMIWYIRCWSRFWYNILAETFCWKFKWLENWMYQHLVFFFVTNPQILLLRLKWQTKIMIGIRVNLLFDMKMVILLISKHLF